MSRCFPYPPPGFEKKHDPLIESSIKLSKEKSRDKERKKERKEKKREKKEKSKDATVKKEDRKHDHKKRQREERKELELNGKNQSKERVEEIEQLERSSLTEEQGLPSSQYLCDSPDSSQNSSKRIKLDATEAPVSVLRIRLSSLKQVEIRSPLLSRQSSLTVQKNIGLPALDTPLAEQKENAEFCPVVPSCLPVLKQRDAAPSVPEREPCFSGRPVTIHGHNESSLQIDAVVPPCLPLFRQRVAAPSVPEKEPCFSGRIETTNAYKESNNFSLFPGFKGSSKSRKMEIEIRDLMANWHPQPIQIDQADVEDDEDWLFGSKKTAVESKVPVQGEIRPSWPPRGCYNPEADVYILPYVLPF